MTTVPPSNSEDRNEEPTNDEAAASFGADAAADSPASTSESESSSSSPAASGASASSPASPTGVANSTADSEARPLAGSSAPSATSAASQGEDSLPTQAAPSSADEPSAAPAAPGRSSRISHAAPRTVSSPASSEVDGDDLATRRMPSADDDAALRAERERRFGSATRTSSALSPEAAPVPESAPEYDSSATSPAATETYQAPVARTPASSEDDPFIDFDGGSTSRAAAHWWGILIAIVFGPVAWYLLADGGERVYYSLQQNLDSYDVLGLVELGGGLLAVIIMLMAARWSSVGSIVIGSIATLIGAAFIAVPSQVADFLASQSVIFDRLGQFGTNVFDHLGSDGHSGRLLLYGITFIFVGVVSHGARRQGRRQERRKIALGE